MALRYLLLKNQHKLWISALRSSCKKIVNQDLVYITEQIAYSSKANVSMQALVEGGDVSEPLRDAPCVSMSRVELSVHFLDPIL